MITRKQIQKIIKRIADNYNPQQIILFGSYAYGHPAEDSDLIFYGSENMHKRLLKYRA